MHLPTEQHSTVASTYVSIVLTTKYTGRDDGVEVSTHNMRRIYIFGSNPAGLRPISLL